MNNVYFYILDELWMFIDVYIFTSTTKWKFDPPSRYYDHYYTLDIFYIFLKHTGEVWTLEKKSVSHPIYKCRGFLA